MKKTLKHTLAFVLAISLCAAMAATTLANDGHITVVKGLEPYIALHEGDTLNLTIVLDSGDYAETGKWSLVKDRKDLPPIYITADMWNKDITYTVASVTEQDAGLYESEIQLTLKNEPSSTRVYAGEGILGSTVTVETNNAQVERIAAAMTSGDIPEVKAGDKALALPAVEDKCSIALSYSSRSEILSLDGGINPPKNDVTLKVRFKISRGKASAETKDLVLLIPGTSPGSGGGGGGSRSGNGVKINYGIPVPVTAEAARQAAVKAVEAAQAVGSTGAYVRFENISAFPPDAFKAVAEVAAKAGITATVTADVIGNGAVQSRLYVDAAAAARLGNELDLSVATGHAATEAVFAKYFKNNIAVVRLGQNGSFGIPVKLAVKLDLSKLNTQALRFYSYNNATNTYSAIAAPDYFIDANGYLHFSTSLGGSIIITDSPLTLK